MTTVISNKIYTIFNSVSPKLTPNIERTVSHKKLVEVSFQRFGNEILQKIVLSTKKMLQNEKKSMGILKFQHRLH